MRHDEYQPSKSCPGMPLAKYVWRRGNMSLRGHKGTGQDALVRGATFVLMVSSCVEDLRQLAEAMQEYRSCKLVTVESIEQLAQCVPNSCPALAIVADDADQRGTERALVWVRRSWPRCRSVVVSGTAERQFEIAVRGTGSLLVVRPVSQAEWLAILEFGLGSSKLVTREVGELA
jgi:hypothetical protein